MNRLAWLVLAGFLLGAFACTSSEATVSIKLTNPQNLAVAFAGYYKVQSTGDSVWLADNTPCEYDITVLVAGDRVSGVIGKTSTTDTDTLKLQVLLNGKPEVSGATAMWFLPMQFQLDIVPR